MVNLVQIYYTREKINLLEDCFQSYHKLNKLELEHEYKHAVNSYIAAGDSVWQARCGHGSRQGDPL